MIRVTRGPAPAFFRSKAHARLKAEAQRYFSAPASRRTQTRFHFPDASSLAGHLIKSLYSLFAGRCAFCEQPLRSQTSNIERYRPRHVALDASGNVSPDHYWWLAYEWTNLYLACRECCTLKASRFPVLGRRAPLLASPEQLADERPLLIEPCGTDDPEHSFYWTADGKIHGSDSRGKATIDILGLNRASLCRARRAEHALFARQWRNFADDVTSGQSAKAVRSSVVDTLAPFQAMRRHFLGIWSRKLQQEVPHRANMVRDAMADANVNIATRGSARVRPAPRPVSEAVPAARLHDKARYIERVDLYNFRSFRKLSLRVEPATTSRAPWLLLLGENSAGKTSVLQAIALTLMAPAQRRRLGIRPDDVLRFGARNGFVRVHVSGVSRPQELRFAQGSRDFSASSEEMVVLLRGYGATRVLAENERPVHRALDVEATNLFDPSAVLPPYDAWMAALSRRSFDNVAAALKDLVALGADDRLFSRKGKVLLRLGRHTLTLRQLSEGYRTVIGMAADIISVMIERWAALEVAEGVVLVDELETHLHPRWKMQIVSRLRRAFPRVQFIATSHDPLCVRGLTDGEVVVMQKSRHGTTVAQRDLPNPAGLRVDQLLTSEYFGLSSTVEPELQELFDEYYRLLARPQSPRHVGRLATLRERLVGLRQLGETRRERLMLEVADRFLAIEKFQPDEGQRRRRREQASDDMLRLWTETGF